MSVTLKDVAALAGVSSSTASRVCKDNLSISRETKDKVRRAMEQLGYEPNFQSANSENSQFFCKKQATLMALLLPAQSRMTPLSITYIMKDYYM